MPEDHACVYVVDDDRAMRARLRNLLRSAGLDVQTCASAHECLTRQRPTAPSGLVLDVQLPGLSGLELEDSGSTTVSASNGREALEKVAAEVPDLIVTGCTRLAVIATRPRVTALWRSSRLPTCTRIPSRRSMRARRVSRLVSCLLDLTLGKGRAVLLATLSAWFSS